MTASYVRIAGAARRFPTSDPVAIVRLRQPRSAGLIADEARERERDAELERALIDPAPEDLLGLPDAVADGVLVDTEAL